MSVVLIAGKVAYALKRARKRLRRGRSDELGCALHRELVRILEARDSDFRPSWRRESYIGRKEAEKKATTPFDKPDSRC